MLRSISEEASKWGNCSKIDGCLFPGVRIRWRRTVICNWVDGEGEEDRREEGGVDGHHLWVRGMGCGYGFV